MAFLQPGNESVSVEAHKYTHTCIHSHMRIHPPDLADLFPSSGRRGISFLEMLILSIKKDCVPSLWKGEMMMKCLNHSHPTCLIVHISFLPFFVPTPSSLPPVSFSLPLSYSPMLLPSASLPELTFAVR